MHRSRPQLVAIAPHARTDSFQRLHSHGDGAEQYYYERYYAIAGSHVITGST
jgi:hypothetical protein